MELSFDKYCGDDNLCSSNLKADLAIQGLDVSTGRLEISERGEVVLEVAVSNMGEPAYSASLEVIIDGSFSYVGRSDDVTDVHCDVTVTAPRQALNCNLGNPYDSNRTDLLVFRVRPLTPRPEVVFTVTTNTTSEDVRHSAEHARTIPVKLVKRAEVSVRASVEPKHIWYGGMYSENEQQQKTDAAENSGTLRHTMPRVMSDVGNKITHSFQVSTEQTRKGAQRIHF